MAAGVQGATCTWVVTAKDPRLGIIKVELPRWKSAKGGSSKRQVQSPSPRWSRRHVTFEDDFDEDTGAREPCPLAWGDMEETRMEEEELGAHLPLNLTWKVSWLEPRGRWPPAGPGTQALPQQQCQVGQVESEAVGQPDMVQELSAIPSQSKVKEFMMWVQASFQLPKASSCSQGVDNDYLVPPAPQSLDCFQHKGRITTWDIPRRPWHMPKPCNTGQKKAQLPLPGEPCQMAESMLELWRAMEPLTTFTNAEVLEDATPLHWVKIMSIWTLEPMDPPTSQEQSNSRNWRAYARATFAVTHGMGHLKPTVTTWADSITSPSPEGRVTAGGDQWLMENTSPRVHWDCEIPIGGQPTLWSCGHPTRTSQGTGSHIDSGVHDVLCLVTSRFHVRGHLHQHGDLLREPCGPAG